MSSSYDLLGKRGEAIVLERLLDFCGNDRPYFDPHFLGEKCPTFDYLVELVGVGGAAPYFLAQVKATKQSPPARGTGLPVGVSAGDVVRMAGSPIPAYLIGVDEPKARAYIVSVHGGRKTGLSRMPTKYPLTAANLKRLWDEVKAHWATLDPSKRTSVFPL